MRPGPQDVAVPTHPEEMKATFEMRVGDVFEMRSSARITPAGMVAVGIGVAAIVLAVAAVYRARR